MERFFNNAGPIVPSDYYHLDPLTRLDWEEIQHLIAAKLYFVLHAPRHTGKTSTLLAMMKALRISNRIYQEILPRQLTWSTQVMIANQEISWYITPDHRLDMQKLLAAFQQFFREHSDSWSEGFDYKEAAPQLLLQAFLQRIINGGGRISREYGLGRKRTDLLIEWPTDSVQGMYGPLQRIVIELKLLRGNLDSVISKGLEQTADYCQRVGADEAHLIIFNRDPETHWDDKIWQRDGEYEGLTISLWGA